MANKFVASHQQSKFRVGVVSSAIVLGLALSACGSGSDGDASPPTPPAPDDDVAIAPVLACTMDGIGKTALTTDDDPSKGFQATILDVTEESLDVEIDKEAGVTTQDYCLVKVKVDPAINIWVAMPSDGTWNGRFRSEGGGGYAGRVEVAEDSVQQGFVGVMTDTGHEASAGGSFGMLEPGKPNIQLQEDFAFRSEHLMAVVGKQLTKAYYEQDPSYSYWYGCSTGGRQGLMMAQRYPEDYDGILAGAPAIHWDRFQAYQIWPQVVMKEDVGAPIAGEKLNLATERAVAACDADDGVVDGVIDDPRTCSYQAAEDTDIVSPTCTANTCLTPAEADAIDKIWDGARNLAGDLLWPGVERGNSFSLAATEPFSIAVEQPRYWVYFDPNWDWKTLNYQNYEAFFNKTVEMVNPVIGTDDPDLSRFKSQGGKLIMYHGWSDPLIMPQGTIRYYDNMVQTMGADEVNAFANLYMVPGMGHCSGGTGPDQFGQGRSGTVPRNAKQDIFRALMAWTEKDTKPAEIVASKINRSSGEVERTRPLCVYPLVARHDRTGSTDDAASFSCVEAD